MSQPKLKTKFVSNNDKETLTRLSMAHRMQEMEFKQKTNIVTDSLLKAKCLYIMSVMFEIDVYTSQSKEEGLRKSPEMIRFLDLLEKNALTSKCIFIPFRSISQYMEEYPLTIFMFVKHDMNTCQPVCHHILYRENMANKVDTYKSIFDFYHRLKELTSRRKTPLICHFDRDEDSGEYHIQVREVIT